MREQQYQRHNTRLKDDHEYEQQRPRFYSTDMDDSDDIDMATSDSSQSDGTECRYLSLRNKTSILH
jgi:kinesin family protein C2/C3